MTALLRCRHSEIFLEWQLRVYCVEKVGFQKGRVNLRSLGELTDSGYGRVLERRDVSTGRPWLSHTCSVHGILGKKAIWQKFALFEIRTFSTQ